VYDTESRSTISPKHHPLYILDPGCSGRVNVSVSIDIVNGSILRYTEMRKMARKKIAGRLGGYKGILQAAITTLRYESAFSLSNHVLLGLCDIPASEGGDGLWKKSAVLGT